jgi:hypothetical protein
MLGISLLFIANGGLTRYLYVSQNGMVKNPVEVLNECERVLWWCAMRCRDPGTL